MAGEDMLFIRHGIRCVPENGAQVEVLLAVGEQVGCENIHSDYQMNKAVVLFSTLINSGLWIRGVKVLFTPLNTSIGTRGDF